MFSGGRRGRSAWASNGFVETDAVSDDPTTTFDGTPLHGWPVADGAAPDSAPPGNPAAFETEVAYVTGVAADGTLAGSSFWGDIGFTAFKWGSTTAGTGAALTYTFDPRSNFTATEKNTFITALDIWSAIANVTFTPGGNKATVKLIRGAEGSGAYEDGASTAGSGSNLGQGLRQHIISFDTARPGFDLSGSLDMFGGYGMSAVIHEVGHLLGLGHAGLYNGAADVSTQQLGPYDERMWTIMSYIHWNLASNAKFAASYDYQGTNWGFDDNDIGRPIARQSPHTPMPLDVVAIQRLYGKSRASPFDGNDVFGFNTTVTGNLRKFYDFTSNTTPVVTIYDQGHHNTLDLSGFTQASTVSLVPGTFSSAGGLVYNIAIAFGTTVETAITGDGADTLIGSAVGNVLIGGRGDDTLSGGGATTS